MIINVKNFSSYGLRHRLIDVETGYKIGLLSLISYTVYRRWKFEPMLTIFLTERISAIFVNPWTIRSVHSLTSCIISNCYLHVFFFPSQSYSLNFFQISFLLLFIGPNRFGKDRLFNYNEQYSILGRNLYHLFLRSLLGTYWSGSVFLIAAVSDKNQIERRNFWSVKRTRKQPTVLFVYISNSSGLFCTKNGPLRIPESFF